MADLAYSNSGDEFENGNTFFTTNYLYEIFNRGSLTCAGYTSNFIGNLDNNDETNSKRHI